VTWLVLPPFPSFFKVCIDCSKGFCFGISGMYVWWFNQISTLYYFVFWIFDFLLCDLLERTLHFKGLKWLGQVHRAISLP
jgi:hypothetical protein